MVWRALGGGTEWHMGSFSIPSGPTVAFEVASRLGARGADVGRAGDQGNGAMRLNARSIDAGGPRDDTTAPMLQSQFFPQRRLGRQLHALVARAVQVCDQVGLFGHAAEEPADHPPGRLVGLPA